jgi:hypothetical protein
LCNRPISVRSTSWTQSHPTNNNNNKKNVVTTLSSSSIVSFSLSTNWSS